MTDRKSIDGASDADDLLLNEPGQIADQEARNGLLQFDEVQRLIAMHASSKHILLRPELVQELNRLAIEGIRKSAGHLRRWPISITNTHHRPPPHEEVEKHLEEMCEYVSSHWNPDEDEVETAIHLAAYLMWRINWIHPFSDGNGRTSRAVSYLVLGIRLGRELGGTPTIADQIVDNKGPYYFALDAADEAWARGQVDVSVMERFLAELLARQLLSIVVK